jgi:serine/threonine-protein kinase
VYGRDPSGHFLLVEDADGDAWDPDYPVLLVTWTSAMAYADWWADHTGLPWRLPAELEWEKAARGVDRRMFPWGNRFDATLSCTWGSRPGRPLPRRVGTTPTDRSVYGVLDMAGLAREWCADPFRHDGPEHTERVILPTDRSATERVMRGGCWNGDQPLSRISYRTQDRGNTRTQDASFRLVRSV